MNVIEKHLHEHFANVEDGHEPEVSAGGTAPAILPDSVPETFDQPFAKVNSVVENSPAQTAGLKAGDLVRNFGYVNHGNHDNLRKVAECVQGNEGVRFLCASKPKAKLT
jgi:26S proteasome regulatory subunit N4